ncbi:hypothetical protein DAPPUDRAFT_304692 [Daphnia pulex]|uniref:Uncharacterized protein n=1 Tax=Daphnia pulex TaxID=6669 RepID=E9FVU2_DAPPU|nr:hypothetical protein DAPPUDRAFT_304692 [Daphnia pulex]|eukprot:EFX89043.1 hypothetical protein DAPPUDRAFT_304692 [Daphnia pulex]
MEIKAINREHFNMATRLRTGFSPRPRRAYYTRAATQNSLELQVDDNRLTAISTGTTSYLPLIGLPKKKVDFNPTQSIIQPLSTTHDELWLNLSAEITRRKSTSSDTVEEMIAQPSVPLEEPASSVERPGRMVRIQHHFKKALTRLRKVFQQPADVTANNDDNECPDPLRVGAPARQRSVVRRDSNVTNAKRLAAKRKRPGVMDESELADPDGLPIHQQFQSNKLSGECEADTSEITSELLEIFEHLTVSVSKRRRLDSTEPYVSQIRSC